MSSWNGTMSTTGCRVGTSVTSQPSSRSAPAASAARAAARPSPSRTKQRTVSSTAARCPCRSSSSWCASAARYAPSRSFSAASCAVGQSRPAPATRSARAPRRAAARPRAARPPRRAATRRPRPAARRAPRPRRCSSPCGSSSPRPRAWRRRPRRRARRVGPSAFAGHEPLRAGERLRGLERQRRPALVADEHEHIGLGRLEHELERVDPVAGGLRGVERGAAADDGDAPLGQPLPRREPAPATPAGPRPPLSSSRRPRHPLYHAAPWRSSSASRWTTACAS